jgi:transketolase
MRGIPPMHVFCPADEADLVLGLPQVLSSSAPVYIRHNALKPVIDHTDFEYGRAEWVTEGRDVTILVYGMLLAQAWEARNLLEAEGVSVRLLNMRMLKPIDEDAILRAAAETSLLVTVEDHFLTGGLFSIVSEILVRHRGMADVLPLALVDRWFKPALLPDVLKYEGFTGSQIADSIRESLLITANA